MEERGREGEGRREPIEAFYNLISEVTSHHFYHALLITQTDLGAIWEGTSKSVTPGSGVTEALLGTGTTYPMVKLDCITCDAVLCNSIYE